MKGKGIKHRRQAHLQALIQEIKVLKTGIDPKHAECLALKQGMDAFEAQYRQFLEILDQQKRELENEIRRCRFQVRHLKNAQKLVPEHTLVETGADGDEPYTPVQEDEQVQEKIQSLPLDTEDNDKSRIRKYFAHFWHPDMRPENSDGLMLILNTAFNESENAVDMMIAIPWHEAWVQSGERETWHDQLGRLTEWKLYLEEGLERVEQRLAQLQQDWRYSRYQEWDEGGKQSDYFAVLANQERREIGRLEQTLKTLQEQLAHMQQESGPDEAANE